MRGAVGVCVLSTDPQVAQAHSSVQTLTHVPSPLPFRGFGPVSKLEQYNCPSFFVLLFPNLLFILTHFVALDCAGQAESLDQPATILNQLFNIAACSYLKNKGERHILKRHTQRKG